jgi:hypothetical protein
MKLKKGSAEAKRFMASIRAKKKGAKKTAVKKTAVKKAPKKTAVKKASTHKDTKSHNVKISVMSGITEKDLIDEINWTRKKINTFILDINKNNKNIKKRPYTLKENSYMRTNLKLNIAFTKKLLLKEKQILKNLLQINKIFNSKI